jgi:hypothetical protein
VEVTGSGQVSFVTDFGGYGDNIKEVQALPAHKHIALSSNVSLAALQQGTH